VGKKDGRHNARLTRLATRVCIGIALKLGPVSRSGDLGEPGFALLGSRPPVCPGFHARTAFSDAIYIYEISAAEIFAMLFFRDFGWRFPRAHSLHQKFRSA
jgi:hypothetical protein